MLCTDGLWGALNDLQIHRLLSESCTLKEKLLPLLGPDASADDLDAYQWHIVAEK